MDMNAIKRLAEENSSAELEGFIDDHLKEGSNAGYVGANDEETMNVLSKASYIKGLIEKGEVQNVNEGIRKLAGTMRGLQQA